MAAAHAPSRATVTDQTKGPVTDALRPAFLLTVDPGLDRAAAVLWDLRAWREPPLVHDVRQRATRVRDVQSVTTLPGCPMAERLARLFAWAEVLPVTMARGVAVSDPFTVSGLDALATVALVEWPVFSGNYAGRGRQRSANVLITGEAMSKLYAATGAIVAGLSRWCAHVEFQPAAKIGRETKQAIGAEILKGSTFPRLSNDDTRSAAFIGASADWSRLTIGERS